MKTLQTTFILAYLGLFSIVAWASIAQHAHTPYAGFETREIKGLSEQDIEDIEQGRGWGLALPAELSGLPGPLHLLELKEKLELTPQQIKQIQTIYEDMRKEAIETGQRFLQAERKLSQAFEANEVDPQALALLIEEAENARGELRFIHLSRHLMTPDVLTRHQIKRYAVLRGYTDDPCAEVPEGHNADMWRKHNNCE